MSVPTIHPTQPDNIPKILTKIPNWVCYQAKLLTKADGSQKYTKIPIDPKTGGAGKSNDPGTWGDFETAKAFLAKSSKATGLGFVFQRDKKISAIDIDNCFDDKGDLHPDAEAIIEEFDSYTELSPSGNGVHIFIQGTLPKVTSGKYQEPFPFEVEVFCDSYFMTMTGILASGPSSAVERRTKPLNKLYTYLESAKKTSYVAGSSERPEALTDVNKFEDTVIPMLADLKPEARKTARSPSGTAGWVWKMTCPWHEDHRSGGDEGFVFFYSDGMPAFKCFHTACQNKGWADLSRLKSLPEPSYIDDFNSRHAVVQIEGQTKILNERFSPDGRELTLTTSSFQDFKNLYMNKTTTLEIRGEPVQINLANQWLRSSKRRQYSRIVFEPDTSVVYPLEYNLFRGFSTVPTKGCWKRMREHVEENVCRGVKEHSDWLFAWMARILQQPGSRRPGTCPVLRGGQGTGKSLVGTTLGRLVDPHFAHLTLSQHLTGNFNAHLKDKLLVFADEALFAGNREGIGRLKALITEERLSIEPKGVDAFDIRNHINLIMASNEDWVIPAEIDERRFFVLDIDPKRAKDTKFFGQIVKDMENGGYEAMAYDLMKLDWESTNLRLAPMTDALIEQKESSMESVAQYWSHCLEYGQLIRADSELNELDGDMDNWPVDVRKSEVYSGYCLFCRRHGVRYKEYSAPFWRIFKRLVGEWAEKQSSGSSDRRHVHVPDLETARAAWRAKLRNEDVELADGY